MPFRRRPKIETSPAPAAQGFEHVPANAIAMLTWLQANQVEFVLVGPVAEAIRGRATAGGPVAIVPAPYRRNFERLSRALGAVHACLRPDGGVGAPGEPLSAKAAAELLTTGRRLTFSCGSHYLDVEAAPEGGAGGGGYQELLYEAGRFELTAGLSVEVAAPEDIERYAHVRRTGTAPEIRITRGAATELEQRAN